MAVLIGQRNVNLSAVVRFPVDTNFKGVPSVVMQLAASDLICVRLKKNIHHQYLTHQIEVLQPTVALCELLLLSYDVSVVNMRLLF